MPGWGMGRFVSKIVYQFDFLLDKMVDYLKKALIYGQYKQDFKLNLLPIYYF